MSRRSRRREKDRGREPGARPEGAAQRGPQGAAEREAEGAAQRRPEGAAERGPERPAEGPLSSLGVQLVLLAAVFVLAVLVAELFGAANLGVAFGVGQIAFAIAVVYLILRR